MNAERVKEIVSVATGRAVEDIDSAEIKISIGRVTISARWSSPVNQQYTLHYRKADNYLYSAVDSEGTTNSISTGIRHLFTIINMIEEMEAVYNV